MTIWRPQQEDLKRLAYRSLGEAVVRKIEAGELKAGDRLPTHRQLAFEIGLSVQTVSRAYEALIRRDFISSHVGRGTYVLAEPEHHFCQSASMISSSIAPII